MSHKATDLFKEYIMDNFSIPGLSGEEEYKAILESIRTGDRSGIKGIDYNKAEDGLPKRIIDKSEWD